ncbi:hypothetical protein BZG36_03261 [Bifiguratus adelaidae]|uniref:FAD dependent oxidoreductase domain-containing protein n=1 Tax=Bifiguratus adelaidae TaxID=1938954 RepID=A0A261XXF4_9FUNG|nr:hypothetical protein BZG36_03261 [Bifiguratus adelaidae]
MPARTRIIIVGGGCFGISTAYAFAKRGTYDVILFDRQNIPAPDAASTDITKVVRFDYGSETHHMVLGLEALPLWRELNKVSQREFGQLCFHETGVLFFGRNGQFNPFEIDTMKAIRDFGYGDCIEVMENGEAILKRYPQFRTAVSNGYDIAYYNKLGGWCDSSMGVRTMHYLCKKAGVQFITGDPDGTLSELIFSDSSNSKVIGIKTRNGKVHYADKVILATGAWTPSVVDTDDLLVATGQTVIHVMPTPDQAEVFKGDKFPVWAGDWTKSGFYGFPSIALDGRIKIARHSSGYLNPVEANKLPIGQYQAQIARSVQSQISVPRTKVTNPNDTIPAEALAHAQNFMREFMPQLNEMPLVEMRVCWYCDSVNGNFLISEHPRHQDLYVASGDSGHGMKFLPVVGEPIADVVEGKDPVRAGVSLKALWAWNRDTSVGGNGGMEGRKEDFTGDGKAPELKQMEVSSSSQKHKGDVLRAGWTEERPVLGQGLGKMVPHEVLIEGRAKAKL